MSCPRVIKVCGIGLVGPAGKSILSGNGAPTVAVGSDGEHYIDLTASRLYGPKMSGAWGAGTLLKGDKGDKGDQGDPAAYSNATPQPLGATASAGDDQAASRADHVHARPTAAEVGADASGTAAAAVAAHVAAADAHPGYLTPAEGDAAYATVAQGAKADTAVQPAALATKADLVNGLVPSSQLPGFVDDVIEGANLAAFPATGESGKLYVALDTGKTYRWSGSAYVEISASPGSTDAVPEGVTNLYHTTQRAAAAAPVQSVAGKTGTVTLAKGDVGLGSVDNTSDANKPISNATQTALDGKVGTNDARLSAFTASQTGLVPASGGGTSNFLRADGTFAAPPGGAGTPGGSNTQIQFNDGGTFGGDVDLTYNKTTNLLTSKGDILLDDGGSFTTTLQTVTATANRTISFPDATGTVALVGGSSGQVLVNTNGAVAGLSTLTADGSGNLTLSARLINAFNAAASAPAKLFSGTWFTGGTSTTTKPHVLIEPSGTASNNFSTAGTGLGVNAPSGFAGDLAWFGVGGVRQGVIKSDSSFQFGRFGALNYSSGFIVTTDLSGVAYSGYWGSDKLQVHPSMAIAWGSAQGYDGATLALYRDAAHILAQRNALDAQTTRIYNTFTSATNFERAKVEWAGNILRIGTEKGTAGGTARDMELQTDGTTRITVKAHGAILFSGIPTTNPNVAGQLWNDGGTLKISAG